MGDIARVLSVSELLPEPWDATYSRRSKYEILWLKNVSVVSKSWFGYPNSVTHIVMFGYVSLIWPIQEAYGAKEFRSARCRRHFISLFWLTMPSKFPYQCIGIKSVEHPPSQAV